MVDKFVLAGILREAALWGWVMGASIFVVTLVGVVVDEAILERLAGRLGLPFWHGVGVLSSPLLAWWLIGYRKLLPVV